jgi:hypothetical protein
VHDLRVSDSPSRVFFGDHKSRLSPFSASGFRADLGDWMSRGVWVERLGEVGAPAMPKGKPILVLVPGLIWRSTSLSHCLKLRCDLVKLLNLFWLLCKVRYQGLFS